MYEIDNNVAKINGITGKYSENTVTNPSERYGRNAVDNFYNYAEQPLTNGSVQPLPVADKPKNLDEADEAIAKIEKFAEDSDAYLKSLPPLEFEYRYMPNISNGKINKEALLAAANEEMEHQNEFSLEEMNARFAPDENYTFEGLDLNGDKKIDNSEFATSIIAADMLSKSPVPDTKNIDGTINPKGMDAVIAYAQKSNVEAAKALYTSIYNKYNLGM